MTTFTLESAANQLQHEIDRCKRLVEVEDRDPKVMMLNMNGQLLMTYADKLRLQIRKAQRAIDDDDTHAMVRALARLRECR